MRLFAFIHMVAPITARQAEGAAGNEGFECMGFFLIGCFSPNFVLILWKKRVEKSRGKSLVRSSIGQFLQGFSEYGGMSQR